jgi:hypothetical protein
MPRHDLQCAQVGPLEGYPAEGPRIPKDTESLALGLAPQRDGRGREVKRKKPPAPLRGNTGGSFERNVQMVADVDQNSRVIFRQAAADDDGCEFAPLAVGELRILRIAYRPRRHDVRIVAEVAGKRFALECRSEHVLDFAAFRRSALDLHGILIVGDRFERQSEWLGALQAAAAAKGVRQ